MHPINPMTEATSDPVISMMGNVSSVTTTQRYDIYRLVHKGLRAFMCDTLCKMGKLDVDDEEEIHELVSQLDTLLHVCRSHLHHENHYIHPALEARAANSSAQTAKEHDQHEQAIKLLENSLLNLQQCPAHLRTQNALALYRRLAIFIAENLEHMQVEESYNTQVLWQHYSDEELQGIERELISSVPEEESRIFWRWMLPYMTHQERLELLGKIRNHAPEPVWHGMLALVKMHASPRDVEKLINAL